MHPVRVACTLILVATCVAVHSVAADGPAKQRPNVLFLVSDDLRPELGCYGNSVIKSPNIDRLAKRGIVFNRAYCQQAVCSPSRSSVLTGMRPDSTKVWDLNTHFRKALPDVVTLPRYFRDNGYTTRGLGKIYHGGFDDPDGWSNPATVTKGRRQKPSEKSPGSNSPSNPAPDYFANVTHAKLTKTDRGLAFGATDDPPHGGGEGELADQAIAAMREFKEEKQPFFLAVGFHKPHLPLVVPRAYWDLYDATKIPMPENRFLPKDAPEYALVEKAELWNYSGVPDLPHLPDDYMRLLRHGYYAAVSYMDAQLGRVVDELQQLGLAENTIIILWGDHGWKLGDHDRWAKHSNCENDARAPLIISAPGMKSIGTKTDALVEFVDIYPTLVDLAGLPLPGSLEGKSVAPLLDAPNRSWASAALSQYPRTAANDTQTVAGITISGVTVIESLAGADNVIGSDGDDSFSGGAGNDSLDGGAGVDTANFAGAYASFTFAIVGAALQVTDGAPTVLGDDGVDTLLNFEFLKFSDALITVTSIFNTPPVAVPDAATVVEDVAPQLHQRGHRTTGPLGLRQIKSGIAASHTGNKLVDDRWFGDP